MGKERVLEGVNRWNEPILSKTQTKRQHFVPRLYLKNFSTADGKIRVFDSREDREYVSSLENVAVQTRFYGVTLEGQDYSAEDWLAELESDASSILRLLLEDPTKPIPRWDMHFGILKTTERTPRLLTSPLGPNWVATDSAV